MGDCIERRLRAFGLDVLAPTADDRLLEIGCGGGLLLRDALAAGARAAGTDHSQEMVSLARTRARGADVGGQLLTALVQRRVAG